jgi:hypothetical protein
VPSLKLVYAVGTAVGVVACASVAVVHPDDELIGGHIATDEELPATLLVKDNCTAAKVGPRHILLAAHCVTDPDFPPGTTIDVTTSNAVGAFFDAGGVDAASFLWRRFTIERTEVHPLWRDQCASMRCGKVSVATRNGLADVAVVVVTEELTGIPEAPVDLAPVRPGDPVAITGFGCENAVGGEWNWDNQRLRVGETSAIDFDRAIHPGSWVFPEDRESGHAALMDARYLLTPGPQEPRSNTDPDDASPPSRPSASSAGLCPGDSGGPVYRRGLPEPVVVGVNASYSFTTGGWHDLDDGSGRKYQGPGVPVTNWHTRLDAERGVKVGSWLRDLGVRTVCTRGVCN